MADMLATATDLATVLQRDVDTASAVLALEVSTAVVQAAAGQRLVRATTTETVWGDVGRVLVLRQRPIVSITSVTYAGSLLSAGTASGSYRRYGLGLWREIGWAESVSDPTETVVVYEAGYSPGAQELQLARGVTLSLARLLFENPSGATREQIDDYSIAYAESAAALDLMPSMAARLRNRYGRRAGLVRIV